MYNSHSRSPSHFDTPHRRVDSVEENMTKLEQLPQIDGQRHFANADHCNPMLTICVPTILRAGEC